MGIRQPEFDAIKFVSDTTRLDPRRIERVIHDDIIRDWFLSVTDPAAAIPLVSVIEAEALLVQRELAEAQEEVSRFEQRRKTGEKLVLPKRIKDFIELVNRVAGNTNENVETVLKIIKALSDFMDGIIDKKRHKSS